MNETSQPLGLTVKSSGEIDAQDAPLALNIGSVISAIVANGVRPDDVQSMERMMALYERQQDKLAERDYVIAFNALQGKSVNVRANKSVPGKDGIPKFVYANFTEIMDQVSPLLSEHGFTVSFEPKRSEKTVTQTCVLQHISGHSKRYPMEVRIGNGPPNASECQADGAAYEYAKRLALCSALNIVVDKSDVNIEGVAISPDQADELRNRLNAVNGDVAGFLKLAKADSFDEIRTARFGVLDRALTAKEKGMAK